MVAIEPDEPELTALLVALEDIAGEIICFLV